MPGDPFDPEMRRWVEEASAEVVRYMNEGGWCEPVVKRWSLYPEEDDDPPPEPKDLPPRNFRKSTGPNKFSTSLSPQQALALPLFERKWTDKQVARELGIHQSGGSRLRLALVVKGFLAPSLANRSEPG